jgi:hydrogenase-4 component E
MTSLLVGFVIVLIAPIVLASWRMSLLGLALQGLLMGWLMLEAGRPPSVAVVISLVDLILVRGLVVPAYLYRALRDRGAPGRNDVLPANLFSWALAGVTLFLSLRFGKIIDGADASLATQHFVATAAFLLGLLILGTQNAPFSQIIGALRIENAIALFELSAPSPQPLSIQIGLLAVFVLTVATFVVFLRRLPVVGASTAAWPEGPTL